MRGAMHMNNDTHGTAGRAACAACAIAVLLASLAAPARAAPPRGGWDPGAVDPRNELRLRWWLDVYAHSMQEECFIRWMDERCRGTAWRLSMPVVRVEAIYAWWSVHVWPALDKPPEDPK